MCCDLGTKHIAPDPLEVGPGAIHHIWCPSLITSDRSPVTLVDPSYGHGTLRDDARLTKVTRADPQTDNAVQTYGPPGCDLSLLMIGDK